MSTTEETTAPIEAAPEQTATETTPAPAADSTAAPSSNEAAAVAAEPAPVTEQPPAAQPEAATTQPTSAEEPVPSSASEPAQATTDDSAAPQPQGDAPSAVEPVNPPADKRPPETLEEFEAEANELERELAALNEEAAAAETRTTTATDEKAAVDALEEALAGKVQHRDERQSHRAEVEEATVAIEARAASRDGTSDAVDQTAALEEFLAGGRFANMWDVTVSTDDMAALVDAAAVDGNPPSDVLVALQATKDHHAAEEARADEIQAKTAAAKKERIDKNASLLDRFERANNADLRRLNAMKPRIRSALDEQRFHLKRGTHIKAATITRKPKDEFLSLEQAKKQHSKMTETLLEEEDQIAIIDDEIETLKREKTHLLKTSAVEKAALLSNIEKLNKEVEGVAWEQKTLEDENQTMRDTRRDMIRTATQVRHQLRV